jgi:hypothetical protein
MLPVFFTVQRRGHLVTTASPHELFFGVCPQKPQTKRRCNCWKAAWSAPLIDGDAAVESIQLEPILTFMKRGLTLRHWCALPAGVSRVRVMVDAFDRTAAPVRAEQAAGLQVVVMRVFAVKHWHCGPQPGVAASQPLASPAPSCV